MLKTITIDTEKMSIEQLKKLNALIAQAANSGFYVRVVDGEREWKEIALDGLPTVPDKYEVATMDFDKKEIINQVRYFDTESEYPSFQPQNQGEIILFYRQLGKL